jgi:hypothetical protein
MIRPYCILKLLLCLRLQIQRVFHRVHILFFIRPVFPRVLYIPFRYRDIPPDLKPNRQFARVLYFYLPRLLLFPPRDVALPVEVIVV